MRAAAVTAPGRVEVIEVPLPSVGPYDVLCRARVGSVCAGTDTHVIDGTFGPAGYPKIIGHETIGEVVDVGAKVRSFAVGDLVTRVGAPESENGEYVLAWGGMVEFPMAKDHLAMAEDGVSRSEWWPYRVNCVIPAGLLPVRYTSLFITWRETLSYLLRAGIGSARRVVISGSGANGISMAALLRALGAEEVMLIGSPSRKSLCVGRVADRYLDYGAVEAIEDFVEAHVGTFDAVVDATGISGSVDVFLPVLRQGGVVGVYGLDDGPRYSLRPLGASSFTFYNAGYDEAETHDQVVDLVARGLLDPSVWIDETTFGWESIPAAFLAARDRSLVKPLVDLSGSEAL